MKKIGATETKICDGSKRFLTKNSALKPTPPPETFLELRLKNKQYFECIRRRFLEKGEAHLKGALKNNPFLKGDPHSRKAFSRGEVLFEE